MTATEIDGIYDVVDILMTKSQFSLLDSFMECYALTAWRMEIDELLAWATATLPAKSKLKHRSRFIAACLKFHSDPKTPDLWKGLE